MFYVVALVKMRLFQFCDNVGTATRIPVVFYSSWLCHRKQKKLFAKFEHQPLIQALRSYEQVR